MLGFSLIGTPAGFEILSAGLAKDVLQPAKVDLANAVINVFPEADVLMAYREELDGISYLYFVYYRFATEIETSRAGSYYGSVILLRGNVGDPLFLWQSLTDLADVIKDNCLSDDSKFNRDIRSLSFDTPESVHRLDQSLTKFQNSRLISTDKSGFLFVGEGEINNYPDFFKYFCEDSSVGEFQKLYGASDIRVLRYVQEKNHLPIVRVSELRREDEARRRAEDERKRRIEEEEIKRRAEEEKRRGVEEEKRLTEEQNRRKLEGQNRQEKYAVSSQVGSRADEANVLNDQDSLGGAIHAVKVLLNRNAGLEKEASRLEKEVIRLRFKLAKRENRLDQGPRFGEIKWSHLLIGLAVLLAALALMLVFFWNPFSGSNSQTDRQRKNYGTSDAPQPTPSVIVEKHYSNKVDYDGLDPKIKTLGGLTGTLITMCAHPDEAQARIVGTFETLNPNTPIDRSNILKTKIDGTPVRLDLPSDCKVPLAHFRPRD